MTEQLLIAAFLGLVEGLTEFVPVSSTGHLIIVGELLGFSGPPGRVFEVMIQLGAISAVCWRYREKLLWMASGIFGDSAARHLALILFMGFIPAAIIGAAGHQFITTILFSSHVVSVSLVLGGIGMLLVERAIPEPRFLSIGQISVGSALRIGLWQTLAMVPGVSRSGATIIGALLMRVERRAAAEFSFLLAIPTMLGAATYDLSKNLDNFDASSALLLATGFITAFAAALGVMRIAIALVGRYGFAPFGWYRIGIGVLSLLVFSEFL